MFKTKPEVVAMPLSHLRLLLTRRHFLTRRFILGAGSGVAICTLLIAAGSYPYQRSLSPVGTATTSQDLPRVLSVHAQQISNIGPSALSQSFTGVVQARRSSLLAGKALGRIERVAVDVGDFVTRDQVLAVLDSEHLAADLEVARANLAAAQSLLEELRRGSRPQDIDQAESRVRELQANLRLSDANLQRAKSLRDSAAISSQEYDQSRYQFEAMQAQLNAAQKSLELLREGTREEQLAAQAAVVLGLSAQITRMDVQIAETQVKAPYDGQILTRHVDEGAVVAAGQSLLEIAETNELEVHVGLPADLTLHLDPSNVRIIYDDRQLPTELDRMAPAIDESTRTRECIFRIKNSRQHSIVIGSSVSVLLSTPMESGGIWVPTECLSAGERGLWSLYIAAPTDAQHDTKPGEQETYILQQRQVELLRTQASWSEVQGPLKLDELLVLEGVHRIVAGQRVSLSAKRP